MPINIFLQLIHLITINNPVYTTSKCRIYIYIYIYYNRYQTVEIVVRIMHTKTQYCLSQNVYL